VIPGRISSTMGPCTSGTFPTRRAATGSPIVSRTFSVTRCSRRSSHRRSRCSASPLPCGSTHFSGFPFTPRPRPSHSKRRTGWTASAFGTTTECSRERPARAAPFAVSMSDSPICSCRSSWRARWWRSWSPVRLRSPDPAQPRSVSAGAGSPDERVTSAIPGSRPIFR
jgi:hypothetical protein